jgi:hypothetical protein
MPSGINNIVAAGFNRRTRWHHRCENAVPQASALKADRHDPPDHLIFGVFKKKSLIIIDLKHLQKLFIFLSETHLYDALFGSICIDTHHFFVSAHTKSD